MANKFLDKTGLEHLVQKIKALIDTKANKTHTHNYAGSASVGGAATSANKLNTNAGSATQPVYFKNGVPVATTYTLGKSVPSDAKFTDTNTWRGIQNNLTSSSTSDSLSAAQGKVLKTLIDGKVSISGSRYQGVIGSNNSIINVLNKTAPQGLSFWSCQDASDNPKKGLVTTAIICKYTNDGTYSNVYLFCGNEIYVAGTGKTVATTLTFNQMNKDTNTWRGIQDNLTSSSTTESLSAKQGKVLKGLVDGKANSTHTHTEYQNDIKIHKKIDLKSGTFLSCIIEQINKGYRGGKIEINDYCPEDTCNDNHWGFVEWTCNENQFIHMFFYSDRWEIIYVRECCVGENTDTGWHRIGDDCNAWTLNGWHGDNYMLNYRGYGSGYFNSMNVNDWVRTGVYATQDGNTNLPSERGSDTWGTMFVMFGLSERVSQYVVFWNETNHPLWHRHLNGSSWSDWMRMNDGGNAYSSQIASTSHRTNCMNITGFGENGLTYYQTNGNFEGNSDWCHYLIANHGNGETYYHYIIGLPFWGAPMYQRQTGNTSARSGWQKFYTTENITYGTWALTPGQSSLATGNIYLQYE